MEPATPKLILVPTDFSAPSAQALRYAAALAERFSAHLLVIYADLFIPPIDATTSACATFDLRTEDMVEAAREQLQKFAQANIRRDVTYDFRVVVDAPVNAICNTAWESGAQMIVMGTHGRTGLRRLLVGSVTETIMRMASLPVIVVREESTQSSAEMRRIVTIPQSAKEIVAAVACARALAGPNADFMEVPEGADVAEVARAGDAELLVIGLPGDRSERLIRHVACPVLIVNRFAAARLAAVKTLERAPAFS